MNNLFVKNKHSLVFASLLKENVIAGTSHSMLDFNIDLDGEILERSFDKLFSEIAIVPKRIISLSQSHSDKIFVFQKECLVKQKPCADAVITDEKDIAIAIRVADCPSVFIYDKSKRVSALVHSGWKGTRQLIVVKTIQKLKKLFHSRERDIIAAIGPCIRKCCYEVGSEFEDIFNNIEKRQDKYFLDLACEIKNQLYSAGIEKNNIFDSSICSACSRYGFYSYRKQKTVSRNLSFMIMK
ncbi:MAG: peptidoglycan editing factor PgeF [Candidatus Gygaella obscura]|nr:peptidoglycan editing factor PgeF [Candidatus Gygaella obscura]